MTAPTYSPGTVAGTKPAPTAEAEAGCPACPHPLQAHDPIGARYCRATAAGGAEDRGCVCRVG